MSALRRTQAVVVVAVLALVALLPALRAGAIRSIGDEVDITSAAGTTAPGTAAAAGGVVPDGPGASDAEGAAAAEGQTGVATLLADADDPEQPTVRVTPASNLQQLVDSHPPGYRFVLAVGRYVGQSVSAKDGDQFVGEAGTLMDGAGKGGAAFIGPGDDVVIANLVVQGYGSHTWDAVIAPELGAERWKVVGNEVRDNAGSGIKAGPGWVVTSNWVHDNFWSGIGGEGPGIVVENNRVENNNTGHNDTEDDASGMKFVRTTDLIVRDNSVTANYGNGIWTDIDATRSTITGNTVQQNFGAGILVEMSHGATVQGNTVLGNGYGRTVSIDGGGIVVSSSPDVTVAANQVSGNRDAIVAVSVDRTGAQPSAEYVVKRLTVTGNTIVLTSGRTGIVTYSGHPVFAPESQNVFRNNTYTVAADAAAFLWNDAALTLAQWTAAGNS